MTGEAYDSTDDTRAHILLVGEIMDVIIDGLIDRQSNHDASKLLEPEKSAFDELTPLLANTTYGSDEYKANMDKMRPAIDHHQQSNRHHPEYHEKGIEGMTLVDVVEMIADWCAATQRHKDGDIFRSIQVNRKRFGYSGELEAILLNTVKQYGLGKRQTDL